MAPDDDIAAALPDPPPPAPARREAAIGAALRRFDGGSAEPVLRSSSPPKPWTRLSRPQLGTALAAMLVLLVGLPTAWMSIPGPSRPDREAAPVASPGRPAGTARAVDASEKVPDKPETTPAPPEAVAPVSARPAERKADCAGGDCGDALARADAADLPPPPPPSPPPPPPPPPISAVEPAPPPPPSAASPSVQGRLAESTQPSRKSANLAARQESGAAGVSRRGVPMTMAPAPPAARIPELADERDNAVVVTGSRVRRGAGYWNSRGDWNACTVNDPARSLDKCRRQIGAAGKAAKGLTDGLSRAWSGDDRGAIEAFDEAIAANPRSSLLYLNRGLLFNRRGDADRAIADLDKAVRNAPASARAYYNRSLALRARGELRRAEQDEARAADLDKDYSEILDPGDRR